MTCKRGALLLGLAGWVALSAHAAEWSVAPVLTWTEDYASNRFLLPHATAPGYGAYLTAQALLKSSMPTFSATLQPIVSVQRYSAGSGQDTTNRSINATAEWLRERWVLDLAGGYSDLSTLTSEIASTGVVQSGARQRNWNGQGSWRFDQTETLRLTARLSYSDITYYGVQETQGLTSYRYPNLSIGEQYEFSERSSLTLSASRGNLTTATSVGNAQNTELSLALQHSFSASLALVASLGTSEQTSGEATQHGSVGQFQMTQTGERNQWQLLFEQSVTPNGFGTLIRRDQGSLSFSRQLAARWRGSLALWDTEDRELFGFAGLANTRRYQTGTASLDWQSTETSTIGFQAGYDRATTSDFTGFSQSGNGWRAGVNLTWTPRPQSMSR